MKRINKKGFTIVELVIVIAVIGVLAAVLIPTFTKLIRKSRINSDTQLIRNLNTALEADKVETEHKTMESALDAAKAYGYDISKINASATNNEILWDSQNDVFCYVNGGELEYLPDSVDADKKLKPNSYKLWKIYSAAPKAGDNYSIYVAGQGAADYVNDNVVNVGVDCGSYVIENVRYQNTGAKLDGDVVIRTNGGNLTIDAKNDNVIHYGYADSVNVVDVATASYHENGTVKFLEVAAGHIVLEQDSKVSAVHFTATGEGDAAKFENADGKKISIDLSNAKAENISFSRDAVTIADNGTYVAEVKIESTEYIWLFGKGIKEQMVVTDTTAPIAENGTLKTGVVAGAEDGSVAEQIANPAKRNEQGQLVDNNDQVIDLTEVDLSTKDGLDEADVVVEEVADKASVQTGATLFAGGTGSATDPFLIVDYDTFQHVSDLYEEGYYNFKVKDGIASIDLKNWVPVYLNGNFDGSNALFNNLDTALFARIIGETSIVKNFTINANITKTGGVGAVTNKSATLDLTIDSVDVHGTIISDSWVTPYVEFGPGASCTWNLTIKNSISDATLVATGGSASGFVGHPFNKVSQGDLNDASMINIIDSAYIGNMTATGSVTGNNFKYFTINGSNNRVKTYYSESFVQNLGYSPEGTLYKAPADKTENAGKANEVTYLVTNNEDGSKTFLTGNYGKNVVDNYKPTEKKAVLNSTAQATLPANIGDVFTVTKVSGAVKAVVSLQIAPNDQNNYGSYLGTYMSEEIDISSVASGSTFTSEEVRYFIININSGVTSKTGVSGNIFNVVNSYYGKNAHNGASVKIAQFDANGNVLNITSVKIADAHNAE
jgi:prepilin-type N-terminal cleavage/methylation domain-containing protein